MTLPQVLRALGRQWIVLLVGFALTGFAVHQISRPRDVYWTQTTVRFVPSSEEPGGGGNTLISSSSSLVAFTGLVLADLNLSPGVTVSDSRLNILDIGNYDGVWVRLPDTGGQWAHDYGDAVLDVQVSGSDPEAVRRRTARVLEDIRVATAERLGGQQGAPVLIRPVPPTPVVAEAHAARRVALLATFALGAAATFGVALGADRARQWVARRRRPDAPDPGRAMDHAPRRAGPDRLTSTA